MESLTIRLLGIPEIRLGEQPLSFRTRKVLALLVYLVSRTGDARPRVVDGLILAGKLAK